MRTNVASINLLMRLIGEIGIVPNWRDHDNAKYVPYRLYLEAHLFKAGVYNWHGWKVNFRVESITTIKLKYGWDQ